MDFCRLLFGNYALRGIETGNDTGLIDLDLKKAFNYLDHTT